MKLMGDAAPQFGTVDLSTEHRGSGTREILPSNHGRAHLPLPAEEGLNTAWRRVNAPRPFLYFILSWQAEVPIYDAYAITICTVSDS